MTRDRAWPWFLLAVGGAVGTSWLADAAGWPTWVRALLFAAFVGVGGAVGGRRVRARLRRGEHGDTTFEAGVRALSPGTAGLRTSWRTAGAVVTGDGTLHWRGRELHHGRLEGSAPRRVTGRELLHLVPGWRVRTVTFDGGVRVEVALDPVFAKRLQSWR
ncbi:hypothetical protein [Kineococcus rhizosphaerae]|uniref:Uncharacterized protein n=1 Tax=Kineococcus rhizosphaerae TaxID=559628 RepID=A0A2T0R024_9ACTN|nr:hypothetical protein [Kineococcus rhizosphaerae]PRY12481.1 hypothetical protein CLV37_11041 [Kineococcus rhizosphaerae]